MKKQILIVVITFSLFLFLIITNVGYATTPKSTYIEMRQDEINKTLTVEKINYYAGEIIEFHGNASYPLPPLEIGDKITNCTGEIVAILSDIDMVSGMWDFPGETNNSIISFSYTIEKPESENNKTPGFEIILVLIALIFFLILKKKRN